MNKTIILLTGLFSVNYAYSETVSSVSDISKMACETMKKAGVITASSPVQCERLKNVNFSYFDFSGQERKKGRVVVLDAVAPHVANIFTSLHALKFPLHQAVPMEFYKGDDVVSMEENNTSAFNYRVIAGQKSVSLHGYGVAIDINPIQNPFLEFVPSSLVRVKPSKGVNYINRMQYRIGKEPQKGFAEHVIDVFAKNGFQYWGGYWDTPIDYQHFQVSRDMAKTMTRMKVEDAALFFNRYTEWYSACQKSYPKAYSQARVNDYVVYLTKRLGTPSLFEAYSNSPMKTLFLINKKINPTSTCVKK